MESDSKITEFILKGPNNQDIPFKLLGFADHQERVYVLCEPLNIQDDLLSKRKKQNLSVFLLKYVDGKANFLLVENERLCAEILEKFADKVLNEV